jgi:signal transduction histidine kinase
MTPRLFADPVVPIFFLYGLAFYTMGIALALEIEAHIPEPKVRRAMTALVIFALVHGFHEWLGMFIINAEAASGFAVSSEVEVVRLVMLVVSFGALCSFGGQMMRLDQPRRGTFILTGVIILFVAGVIGIACWLGWDRPSALRALDTWTRYSLGITGGVLGGVALLARGQECRRLKLVGVARGWLLAGGALMAYGLIGQSVSAPSQLPPATFYNTQTFQAIFGFPVELLRSAAAVVAMIGLMEALRGLEAERREQFDRAVQARLEAQAQAQYEMKQRQALQTELLRRTVAAQEKERTRIARELHDETGQTLTALHFGIEALKSMLESKGAVSVEAVEKLQKLADQALADLKQLVTDLRPAQLDDLGLVAALHWLADQSSQRLGVKATVRVKGHRVRLPSEVETALFRIAQEALTNVAKYAQTDQARLDLVFGPKMIKLVVADPGVGFDPQEVPSARDGRAWGIAGMRERATSVRGRLDLFSAPGEGTRVCAVIPLPAEESSHDGDKDHTSAVS